MARIQRYGGPQVQATNLPGVRISDNMPAPDTSGLQAIAGVIGKIGQAEQDKANVAAQMEIENKLSGLENSTLYDPDSGFLNKQGKDAIGAQEQFTPLWERGQSDIVSSAPRHLQSWAQQAAQRRRAEADRILMRHSVQEGERYYTQQADSMAADAVDLAVKNYLDPARVDEETARAMVAADRKADILGLDDITRGRMRAGVTSAVQRSVVERLMVEDPMAAETRYQQVRERLTAEDQAAIDKALIPLAQDREDMADLQRDLSGIGAPRVRYTGDVTKIEAGTGLLQVPVDQRRKLPYNAPELDAYAAHVEQELDLPKGIINALKNAGEKSNSWQTSPAGAQGVMQFIPRNLRKYGVTDPGDPVQMIEAAGKYLRDTRRQYNGNVEAMIADYNGGPKAANAVLAGRAPPAKETRDYLVRVTGAMGAVDSTQTQTVAVTAPPPQSEVEAMRLIDARYADNPVKRERMRRLAAREWGMRNAERAENDRSTAESIYTAIYAANPRMPLASVITPQQRDWAIRNGRLDAFESELTRRGQAKEAPTDPAVLFALEEGLYRAARGGEAAQAALRSMNPYDPTLPLDIADRRRLASAQNALLSQDSAARDKAKADWMTEEQRIARGVQLLGLTKKSQAAEKQAFTAFYRMAEQAFIQENGKKPDGAQADVLLRSSVQAFLADPDQARKVQAAETLALGGDLGEGIKVDEADRRLIRTELIRRGNPNPTEAQVLQVAGSFYGARRAD